MGKIDKTLCISFIRGQRPTTNYELSTVKAFTSPDETPCSTFFPKCDYSAESVNFIVNCSDLVKINNNKMST